MDPYLNQILSLMYKYQSENNVINCCIQNCQTLYDCLLLKPEYSYKPKAVLVTGIRKTDKQSITVIVIHMVLQDSSGNIIDPSFQVIDMLHVVYYDTIKLFKSIGLPFATKMFEKTTLTTFMQLLKLETEMRNGEFIITNNHHYCNQIRFILGSSK